MCGRSRGSTGVRRRLRTNSLTIFAESEDGDDVTITSYGPVVVPAKNISHDWALGWFLAIVSGVLFTTNNFFVKYLSMDAVEMLLVRSAMQTVVLGLVISSSSPSSFLPSSRTDKVLTLTQGLLSGGRVFLQFACLQYLALGDALTLVFTEPLWTLIISRIVLGTRIGAWKISFGLVLVAGMVLCIQPPFIFGGRAADPATNVTNTTEDSQDSSTLSPSVPSDTGPSYYIGALLALGAALTGASANVIIAKCQEVSSSVMVFYSGLGGVVLAFVFGFLDPQDRILFSISSVSTTEWLVLGMLGGMGILGYFCLTRSLQLIPPTTVAVLRAMEIILAYLAQALVMGEVPDLLAISGSSLVMLSVVAFALEELILSH